MDFQLPDNLGTAKFSSAPNFERTQSEDSLFIYTASEFYGNNELAIILVDLYGSIGNEQDVLLDVALNYGEFLNSNLNITYADEPQIAIAENKDYSEFTWSGTDLELFTFEFKCLINPRVLVVLMAIDSGDLPDDVKNAFMNGFKFAKTN